MLFGSGLVRMGPERINAIERMRMSFSKSEVRSILGLANCFRDRVPGVSLRVEALNSLTRSKTSRGGKEHKFAMTLEAVKEFRVIKTLLQHPLVLQNFVHGRKTILHTDVCEGTDNKQIPGGLGAVITQLDPKRGKRKCVCIRKRVAGRSPIQLPHSPPRSLDFRLGFG